jgi:hypothetical protein
MNNHIARAARAVGPRHKLVGLRDGTSVFVSQASFLSRDSLDEIIT